MALLGMQADMQHKSHFPGCYTTWDLNSDANGAVWPTNNGNRILRNRQCYNGTLPRPSDLNTFYSKDLLKQTMLKHEEVFRDQIHELHRLYRRQKELMDEMEKNDLYKNRCSMETLQANHVLFPKSSNYVQIPYHNSTSVNLVHCRPRISEAKGKILPLHSYDGNSGRKGLDPTRIESFSKASEFMESNCKRFGKKVLDLELPADAYFDSEVEGFSEVKMAPEVTDIPTNALKKIPEVSDRGDKELSNSGHGCDFVFPEGNFVPGSISSKKKVMADLNIPVKLEEDIIPKFTDFQGPIIGHRETSLWDPSGESDSNLHVLSEVVPNSLVMRYCEANLDKQKMQKEGVPWNNKTGQGRNCLNSFPQDLYTEKLSIENIRNKQARDRALPHFLDVTNGKLCHENLQHVARESVAGSDMCNSYQIVPLADIVNSESSSVSPGKHAFKRSPIAVQALPCFKGKSSKSFIVTPRLAAHELGKKLLSSPKYCSATFPQAGLQNDFQLEGHPPATSSVPLNFNNDNEFAFEHSCSPQIAEMHIHDTKSGERRDLPVPLEFAIEQANSLHVHDVDVELEKVEASNSLDFKRILGFHMCNKPPIAGQWSSLASPSGNCPNSSTEEDNKDEEKDRAPDINLEFDHVPDRVKQLAKTKPVAESKTCEKYPGYGVIDLNSCLSTDESLLMPSLSIEIELEPPASPENKECSPPRGESDENLLGTALLSRQEDGDFQEALVRNVVEAIVSISSSQIPTCSESTAREPFKACNSLYWFARVASSVMDDPGSEFGFKVCAKDYDDNEEYLYDEIDYFEAMTLNLTEIKIEESWYKNNGQKEEESSVIFSTNPPKRGRTRRGRKQKDFQSEILPILASLSRHEVTEDLHRIGGSVEAVGARWETGSSRNAGRNGYNTKGRRRSNPRASNVTESTMNMLAKQQPSNRKVGIQQHRRLIEWGKITRRPRGPRYPLTSSNLRVILGQL